ncbi:MAG: type IV secretory system conjugative DNA transfer family protein [Candidatus Paceibacterota bacterium]|nr:type IV secretory system conjugative DNA transfer family protein [Candidatus Paceibacterota bacterium]
MRNIIGQKESSIDARKIMDEGKILIVNLSKGLIGEENTTLLGALMVTKIQLAAMSRADMPFEKRIPFYLYIDEFQTFSTDSFANILSEARKYNLNLIITHQYIKQLAEKVRDAVFGNVGTIISYRIGPDDADFIGKQFTPDFTENDLINIPNYNFYIKYLIDGMPSNAFSAIGLPPLPKFEISYKNEIIENTRKDYAKSREEVEQEIKK